MTTLLVRVSGDEELDAETRRLRRALLELDVQDVRLPEVVAPDGAKGAGTDIGAMVVSLGGSAVLTALVTGVCQVLRTWVTRDKDRRVVIEVGDHKLELTGGNAEQQARAIEAFTKTLELEAD
ncbi:hypothetical protein [Amycolatopsis keratiniphila]|uniref:Uncharacterized protein n=1 Tax=Amycolatopsis keratiniphila subsp. keratiniphila TaxID=227715 RepID=A0A1W2M2X7_9PSEU|nr:hypothetical protein [Amycolatopsis keratiniphila]OLZ58497.1 hypothetical protein BS330_11660 [Amycolatopsis keratiniphila subsp. nogabecina]ONF74407.1 hypothetical protein AVR91_0203755 [Amycolatopsis keratiniphila subsp. keratiniphila]SDU00584.1 hypothetical protein SAMN04489733_0312 [Amycolatopsis keratiniphila]